MTGPLVPCLRESSIQVAGGPLIERSAPVTRRGRGVVGKTVPRFTLGSGAGRRSDVFAPTKGRVGRRGPGVLREHGSLPFKLGLIFLFRERTGEFNPTTPTHRRTPLDRFWTEELVLVVGYDRQCVEGLRSPISDPDASYPETGRQRFSLQIQVCGVLRLSSFRLSDLSPSVFPRSTRPV